MKTNEHSFEIKTEVLQIVEAFRLGEFIELCSFIESTRVEGFICTHFETTLGTYIHYFKIKQL